MASKVPSLFPSPTVEKRGTWHLEAGSVQIAGLVLGMKTSLRQEQDDSLSEPHSAPGPG